MKELYEKLGSVLSSIHPRNERARFWLDKLIIRCHTNSKTDLDKFANAASIEGIRYDFQIVAIIQGNDEQKGLYREVESILHELEVASGLDSLETRLWQGRT